MIATKVLEQTETTYVEDHIDTVESVLRYLAIAGLVKVNDMDDCLSIVRDRALVKFKRARGKLKLEEVV